MTLLSKSEKKQFLMNMAIELFHKQGMSKTTISQITQKANIGKSTFYEYFKNKEDIVNQWFISFFEQISNVEGDLNKIKTNENKIKFVVQYSCGEDFVNEKILSMFVEFWRLAFSEKNISSKELINMFYKEFSNQLEEYLKDGIKNGEFIDCDTKRIASSIMAMVDGHWIQYMVDTKYDLENSAIYSIETLLKGIKNV